MKSSIYIAAFVSLFLCSCGIQSKLKVLNRNLLAAELSVSDNSESEFQQLSCSPVRDTLKVQDFDGREVLIMRAVRDVDGEMVATDVLDAAMVTAKFRNIAERNGLVDVEFTITVPEEMHDSHWQLRLFPHMYVLQDTLFLDAVTITGTDYRKAQLRGYQQYKRFVESIVDDPDKFLNYSQLEIFLKRNLPQVYAFRNDSSFVSDEVFCSSFGVTQGDAIEHYRNKLRMLYNEYRRSRIGKVYNRCVKAPIMTEGLRLDTVMRNLNGDFQYNYIQTLKTRPKLRKVEVNMTGGIFEQDKQVYTIPQSENLVFYISSLSSFAEDSEKYLTEVIERRVEANTACYIDFPLGKSDIDPDLNENATEIARIKSNLVELLENKTYDLDSIVVTASSSPEGAFSLNRNLSLSRARAVSQYFNRFISQCRDSIRRSEGVYINLDGSRYFGSNVKADIDFISKSNPENWRMLDLMIRDDQEMTDIQKKSYFDLSSIENPDKRESMMQNLDWYKYVRQTLYPRLRTVKFDFYLHRKGMQKDTVHTTVLDTAYMRGVQALKDHDYKTAVSILRPYGDYNSAVAYCAMDYNASALSILESMEKTPRVNYMLAIIYSRTGDDAKAVEHYMHSCSQDPSFIHRGNLDPEIYALIKKYELSHSIKNTW